MKRTARTMTTKRRTQLERTIQRAKASSTSSECSSFSSSKSTDCDHESCLAWSMSSLMEVLPESPSPICSNVASTSCSPLSDANNYSQLPSFKNQSFYTMSSTCRSEKDIWMEHAKSLCGFPNQQNTHPKENEVMKKNCGSKNRITRSAVLNGSVLTAIEDGLPSLALPSVTEERSLTEEIESHQACTQSIRRDSDVESPNDGRHKLMARPKPYHAFLDEVKKQEFEAEIDAWRKAKHMKLVEKLKRKEAAISDREFRKTSRAMEDMKKQEGKLEKIHAQVLEKTRRRICRAKIEANKKKTNLRRSTIKKISILSKVSATVRKTKSLLWFKLMKLC